MAGISKIINCFISQAKFANSLKTKHYHIEYKNTKIKASFGMGVFARVPWMAFLANKQEIRSGIYPIYIYYKHINLLILAFGISESYKPTVDWKNNSHKKISEYFAEKKLGKCIKYGESRIYATYDVYNLPSDAVLDNDLNQIISIYLSVLGEV